MNRRARRGPGRSRQASMVISRMVSPHAIHRGKAAGSGGLSIGTRLLHPARAHRLYTSDHSRELLRTGCVRRGRASGERRPQPRLFLHGRPRSRPRIPYEALRLSPVAVCRISLSRSTAAFASSWVANWISAYSSGDLTSLKAQIRTAGLSALKAFTCPVILPTPILRSLPPHRRSLRVVELQPIWRPPGPVARA